MTRTNYIVTYDICDPKRLRRVFRICKDHGLHLQLSVFECDLTPMEKIQFENLLGRVIDHEEDQVLFIDLGPAVGRGERVITSVGQSYIRIDPPCFVV